MKKILVFIMALVMTLSLVACGGNKSTSAPASSIPAQSPTQVEEVKFSAEQQALAQEFMAMAEAFDKTVDRVNATPEALEDQEFIQIMNELADEIILADDYFTSPETLTPEIMDGLKIAMEQTYQFIAAAEEALDQFKK